MSETIVTVNRRHFVWVDKNDCRSTSSEGSSSSGNGLLSGDDDPFMICNAQVR
jgi:hypothetical protein